MCSLTNHDLIDILDQSVWFLTPPEKREPRFYHGPMCNDLCAYDLDPEATGRILHEAMLDIEKTKLRFTVFP